VRPCSAHIGIAACGGYLIPRGFGASIAATGGPNLALEVFLTFYVTCVALTWWFYMRKSFSCNAPRASPKHACDAGMRGGRPAGVRHPWRRAKLMEGSMTRSYFKIDFVTKCFSRNGPASEALKNVGLALKEIALVFLNPASSGGAAHE